MPRAVARAVRITITAVLAYVAIGVAYRIAAELAMSPPSPTSDLPPFWSSPSAFLVWFALLAILWPFEVAELPNGGPILVLALFAVMFAVMYLTLALVARRGAATSRA